MSRMEKAHWCRSLIRAQDGVNRAERYDGYDQGDVPGPRCAGTPWDYSNNSAGA